MQAFTTKLATLILAVVMVPVPSWGFKVQHWEEYESHEVESQEHQAGFRVADTQASGGAGWMAGPGENDRYVMLGASLRLPAGVHRVTYRMKLLRDGDGPVVKLDCYDREGERLPALTVRARDFRRIGEYQEFSFEFPWEHSDRELEFRCRKMGDTAVVLDRFTLDRRAVLLEGGFDGWRAAEGDLFRRRSLLKARTEISECPNPTLRAIVSGPSAPLVRSVAAPGGERVLLADMSGLEGVVKVTVEALDETGAVKASYTEDRQLSLPYPARLVQTIPVDFVQSEEHTYYFVRIGDLDGDGEMDYLISRGAVQQEAHAHSGRLLWRYSNEDASFKDIRGDSDVRIYDLDGDGNTEVILARKVDGRLYLCIVDGRTGQIERKTPYPGFEKKRDNRSTIQIANFSGKSRPSDLLVSWDYKYIAALDSDLNLLWEGPEDEGQHTPKVADIDGDGRDEVLCSTNLLDHDGKSIWRHYDLPQIRSVSEGDYKRDDVDSVHIAEMDGDASNGPEVFLSTGAWMLHSNGEVMWGLGEEIYHGQHAEVGKTSPGKDGVGIVVVDWRDRGMWNSARTVSLLAPARSRKLVWIMESEWAVLGDWTGDGLDDIFLGDGRIVDAAGDLVGETADFFSNGVAADVIGDQRCELILVRTDPDSRKAEIEIYANSGPNPNAATQALPRARTVGSRLLNWTCY